jgi:hypothetical protein
MTDSELTAAEALCERATHEDWEVGYVIGGTVALFTATPENHHIATFDGHSVHRHHDAQFCAAARTLLPQALAEVRRLKEYGAGQRSLAGALAGASHEIVEERDEAIERAEAAEAELARMKHATDLGLEQLRRADARVVELLERDERTEAEVAQFKSHMFRLRNDGAAWNLDEWVERLAASEAEVARLRKEVVLTSGNPEAEIFEAEVARLRAALAKYGEHEYGCTQETVDDAGHLNISDKPCTCGLAALGTAEVESGPDLDLLRKMASGEGGARTGALKRAGLLEWTVTEAGMQAIATAEVEA